MIPASSVSHSQTDRKLWPSARAALISGQSAQIWPTWYPAFFAPLRDAASLFRNPLSPQQRPSYTKGVGKGLRDAGRSENFRRGDDWRQIATERNGSRQFQVGATIRNSSRHIATERQQQGGSQAAQNPVVEHKGRDARLVFLWVYLLSRRCFRRDAFPFKRIPHGMQP